MSRILLCGAFGQSNPGDDALLGAFARSLHRHELIVTSPGPVPDVAGVVPPSGPAVARVLREVDGVVVAGGTIFKLLHPSTGRHPLGLLSRTAALRSGAAARRIPFALVDVGAGDLRGRTARLLARHVADRADLLVLRDEESAAVLGDAGATGPFRIGADAAWSLIAGGPTAATDATDGVLVALSHLADRDGDRLLHRLVALVDHLTARDVTVRLQPWQDDEVSADAELARTVRHRARRPGLVRVEPAPDDLFEAVSTCAGARAVVGLRFHGLVAAAAAGRPFLAVAHEPKLAGLARRLGQPSVPPHATPAVLAEAADALLRTAPADRSKVDREIDLAEQSLRLLRVVLSRGGEDELIDRDLNELTPGIPW